MNFLRVMTLIVSIFVGAFCAFTVYDIIAPVLEPKQVGLVFSAIVIFWACMEFGTFAIHMLVHDYNSKKIQQELDMERSFRKMGGDL
jgi:hypothetical protein